MAKDDYRRALEAARRELAKVLQDRSELDRRAAELKKTIEGLSALCDEADHPAGLLQGGSLADVGISDAIRAVLRETDNPAMSPTEIRDELKKREVNLEDYASEMTVIHNTLARLERQGEIIKLVNPEGAPYAYALKTGKFTTMVRQGFTKAMAGRTPLETAMQLHATPTAKK